jgi:filamentous hemagglutinin family protein
LGATIIAQGYAMPALGAEALPSGGQFVAGQGDIQFTGASATITQSSLAGIINWDGFSIGAGNSVAIQNGLGATLNRVTGGDISQIDGLLTATGSAYLINPNGIVVGPGGEIVTGGSFVASTRDIANEDFLDGGAMRFAGSSHGSIVNAGRIVSQSGDVVLIGRAVQNSGTVEAANGVAALGAGDEVLLQTEGGGQRLFIQGASTSGDVTNEGAVSAAQVELAAAHGNVYALAGNTQGLVRATGSAERDGRILLTASNEIGISGTLEARGLDGAGGTVTAEAADIDISGLVDVSASSAGKDGGDAVLVASGRMGVSGTLKAEGGAGASGGFIETSGGDIDIAGSTRVSTLAENGTTGTWLIDPNDLTVAASGGDITGATVSTNLASTNVTLDSDNGASAGNGDIFINDDITWSADTVLILDAVRNIEINSDITSTGTSGGLTLTFGGDYSFGTNGSVTLAGASASLSIDGQAYTLIHSVSDLQAIGSGLTGRYALAGDLDASSTSGLNGGLGFDPIGDRNNHFQGTFEGLNNTISDLFISRGGEADGYIGLFGRTRNSTIQNVHLAGGSVTGGADTGALVGQNGGVIRNVSSSVNVTGVNNAISGSVGGLIGSNGFSFFDGVNVLDILGTVSDSSASGTVTGTGIEGVGGFVGVNSRGTITRSYATGNVTPGGASVEVGGFAGTNSTNGTITLSFASGSVSGNDLIGGFVGLQSGIIEDSYATGSVTGNDEVGGFAGRYAPASAQSRIVNTYSSGAVTGNSNVGGYAGRVAPGGSGAPLTGSFWDTDTSGQANGIGMDGVSGGSPVTGHTTAELMDPQTYIDAGWDIDGDGGTGTIWRIYEDEARPVLRSFLTPITIDVNDLTKTYDGQAASGFTATISDPMAALSGTLGGNLAGVTDAGTYEIRGLFSDALGVDIIWQNGTLTIDPATLTVTVTVDDKVYDGTVAARVSGSVVTGVIGGDDVTVSGSFAFADPNAGVAKNILISGLALNGADANNYVLAPGVAATATITPATLTVAADALSKTYGDVDPGLTFNFSGFVGGDNSSLFTGGLVRAAGETVAGGPYAIGQGTLSAGGNYIIDFTGANFTITPKALSVNVAADDKVYDATVTATGTILGLTGIVGGDDVTANGSGTFAFTDANVGAGKMVNVTGLALSGTDAGNYTLSPTASSSASITPASLSVTADAQTKTYGDADQAFTFNFSGFAGGDNSSLFTGALTRAAGETVAGGPYAISQGTLSAGGNYTINFTGANLTITPAALTVTADAVSKVYAERDPALTFTHSGLTNGDDASIFTGALVRAAGETVAGGPYAITQGTLSAGSNYTISFNGANLTITPAALTVMANALSKVYGAVDPALTFTHSGLTNGDDASVFTGALARANGETVAGGPYAISQGTLSAGSNYTISFNGANLTITPAALSVTVNALSKVYGAADPALTFTHSGLTNGDDASIFTGALARAAGETVAGGPYAITQGTLVATSNYVLSFNGANFTITPAALSVTADALSKVYGVADPALTFTHSGLTNGDDASIFTGALARAAGETVAGGPYAITQGTLSAGSNYTISFNGANLVITPKALSVSVSADDKVYDGTVAATGTVGGLSGIVGGDDVTAWGSFAFNDADVGAGKAVNVTNLTLSGADAGNYTLSPNAATNASITPAALSVSADALSKTYGEADPSFTFNFAGFVGGDNASLFTGRLARAAGETVAGGPYAIGQGTLSAGGNYTINFTGADFTITPAALTITANDAQKDEGDTLLLNGFSVAGLVAGDSVSGVSLTSAGTVANAAPGTYVITASNAAGTGLSNYAITYVNGQLTVIEMPLVQPNPLPGTPQLPGDITLTSFQPGTLQNAWRPEDQPIGKGEGAGGFWTLPILLQLGGFGGGTDDGGLVTGSIGQEDGQGSGDDEERWNLFTGQAGRFGSYTNIGVQDLRPLPVTGSFSAATE